MSRNGSTPYYAGDQAYEYYRDVVEFGADPTGGKSSSEGINAAVSAGNRANNTVTTLPAYVSLPPGVYLITEPVRLLVSTYLVGSPGVFGETVLKAAPELGTRPVVLGYDPYQGQGSANKNFYIALRNVVVDMTAVPKETAARGIEWSVSQGSSLSNIKIVMPRGEGVRHRGVAMDFGGGSGKVVSEVMVEGGQIGLEINNQQYTLKGVKVKGAEVGIRVKRGYVVSIIGAEIEGCGIGLDLRGGEWQKGEVVGGVSVVDTVLRECETGVMVRDKGQGVVLDWVEVGGGENVAVRTGDREVLLRGNVKRGQVWVMGNRSPNDSQESKTYPAPRQPSLVTPEGTYLTKPLPQYTSFLPSQIINIRSDPSHPVYGDNTHDDGPSISAILAKASTPGCNTVVLFPRGIYLTRSTILIPPNTRLVGEVLSTISGTGPFFSNPSSPQAVVHIAAPPNSDVTGPVELSDILISVQEISPGATLLQISLPDVSLWSVVLRVGGSIDTTITDSCSNPNPSTCLAAHTLLHITSTASNIYLENIWGWAADHALDVIPNVPAQNIAVGRGLTISHTSGPVTMIGTSFEHCVLYQYGFFDTRDILVIGQQTESPYWQGQGTSLRAPGPWEGEVAFHHCEKQGKGGDDRCFRAWGAYLDNVTNTTIHGSAMWVFFNGMDDNLWDDPQCEGTGGGHDGRGEVVFYGE
ncbi:hypothetical protein QC761_201970 [Podospora bellae-mahoneyi]|uniref:Rhamnogalacturonase A/B/Epimerase-like pectate lyase domain-containing protein n=1 Tax=Podospora bellae-mahoneyi TaxID=2093777 RepID=A0ABR0FNF3_9PEZI|nr:hypothetical protein QC761_201970 [Podospora bellae-mahoneyi]